MVPKTLHRVPRRGETKQEERDEMTEDKKMHMELTTQKEPPTRTEGRDKQEVRERPVDEGTKVVLS